MNRAGPAMAALFLWFCRGLRHERGSRSMKTFRNVCALGLLGVGASLACKLALRKKSANLTGEVVLITGGSRGLGLALAHEFARRGCRIAICARDHEELESGRQWLASSGAEVFASVCDVTDPMQVHDLLERVRTRFGRIDVLLNNAGMMRVAPLGNMTLGDFEDAMNVMFWGAVYPTLAVLPEMKERGSGRIVTIASVGGKVSVPHLLPYCCAKFAVTGFSEGLRAELDRYGIGVTTIAPGLTRTGAHLNAQSGGRSSAEVIGRFGLGASWPLASMKAERAARQIVAAVARGRAEKILTVQASVLARVHGAFPGLVPKLMGIVTARFLAKRRGARAS